MNKRKFTKLSFIILVVILLCGVTYVAAKQGWSLEDQTVTPAPPLSPTPNPNAAPFPSPTPPAQIPTPPPPVYPNQVNATVGKKFTLKKGQTGIVDTMSIQITQFYNSPCPADAVCIWSGVGTAFIVQLERDQAKGMDSLDAFGYHIEVVKTDHATYADFLVTKIAS